MTTLAENVAALAKERYRIKKFFSSPTRPMSTAIASDITELADPMSM